jgi:hypothetical protein
MLQQVAVIGCAVIAAAAGAAAANEALLKPGRVRAQSIEFLIGLPRKWAATSSKDCRTYEAKNIERLTPEFAQAAAKFLGAFVAVHGHVTITSAHRTTQEQACVCVGEKGPCAGKPRLVKTKKGRRLVRGKKPSHHQLGIALDVRAGSGSDTEFQCLHQFAALNPHFGVQFPLGKRDRPHMELAGRPADLRVAGVGSSTRTVSPCTSLRRMLTYEPLD